jgi:3-oxoacyl-[acyl-carrier-protein] synthase II
MSRRRVVVTGLGVVTPLGCDLDDVWESGVPGRSGVGPILRFDCQDFKVRFGGEIRNFNPRAIISSSTQRTSVALIGSVSLHSSLPTKRFDSRRSILPSAIHTVTVSCWQRHWWSRRNRIAAFDAVRSRAGSHLTVHDPQADHQRRQRKHLRAVGTSRTEYSRLYRLCLREQMRSAMRFDYSDGVADVMIAGGTEAGLTPMGIAGFARTGALSTRNRCTATGQSTRLIGIGWLCTVRRGRNPCA